MTDIIQVCEAATNQFGEVLLCAIKERQAHADFFFLAIKRRNPVFSDAPYMTITGKAPKTINEPVSFHWGHYDLKQVTIDREIANMKLINKE